MINYDTTLILWRCLILVSLFGLTASVAASGDVAFIDETLSQKELFDKAKKRLLASNVAQKESSQAIIDANQFRKKIKRLRSETRKSSNADKKKSLMHQADKLAEELKISQERGHARREESKSLRQAALDLFEQGSIVSWGDNIRSRNPILMDNSTTLFFAHNTKFRSVHPNMLNKMGTPIDNIDKENISTEMSILVPALAGQNAPPELDISSFQLSREQQYFAHIEVKPDNTENSETEKDTLQANRVPHNKIHKWILLISDLLGNPIDGANIDIVGHMPGHVHGLPTQPRVTKQIAPGVYLVEGLKFQMKGWWVMQFNVASSDSADSDAITFNLVL